MQALYDVVAPAKLNLFLHVIGRRCDGLHLLQSLFVLIDWYDTLHFERRSDGVLSRHDLSEQLPADDLCLRAARALQSAAGTTWGADISIDKTVPWGAGMGGGSSDAASTLLALNQLWELHWPRDRLMALGLQLGADVPFFLKGENAFVEGIGERITPLQFAPQRFAVVKPSSNLETRCIFNSPLMTRNTEAVIVKNLSENALFKSHKSAFWGRNDLQSAAEAMCPEVALAAQVLGQHFGNSRMTGSGSAVFSIIQPEAGMNPQLAVKMPADLPSEWVKKWCCSLKQHPLTEWVED
jgi:4-diphosphocytidyl-2-C-methyl-D-erythritol kinase